MNNEENKKSVMVPPTANKGTMMLPPEENGLMARPTPLTFDKMLKVSGGTDKNQTPGINHNMKPPEMKVVELKDGSFVNVPVCAICKTEEEAKKFVMPIPSLPLSGKHFGPPPHHNKPYRLKHYRHHPHQIP